MEKTKVEWCDSTWNPITGCLHDCDYCYARRIADRFKGCDIAPDGFLPYDVGVELYEPKPKTICGKPVAAPYPFGFKPTFHNYRLKDLGKKKFGKTIFVCSMADMFGEWVPNIWIESVFHACKDHPEHRYLFLTKNPQRYYELGREGMLPKDDNFWYGSTITGPNDPLFYSDQHHTFVSVEPILEPLGSPGVKIPLPHWIEWVIFGAETGNRKGKVVPNLEWIEEAVNGLSYYDVPIFMKDSMKPIWGEDIITEFPWED